ncbi:MAG: flavodoxin family protein [Candidatus Nanopelagicales bacterium]
MAPGESLETAGADVAEATLLVVHHTVSPATEAMLDAVLRGTRAEGIAGVTVRVRPALTATAVDVLQADAFLLGTPANMGYMSGALKHFFDQVYYPCRSATVGLGYGLFVHGNQGLEGAVRSVDSIAKGMGWQRRSEPAEVRGDPHPADLERSWELGATLAASVMP